jgi:YbbR domain-containing protein
VKWIGSIWLKKLTEKGGKGIDKDVAVFSFFLLLSFVFWYLNSLEKDVEYNIKYPVRYINLPEERVLADDLPSRLDLYLKGPGYSILKLKLSGNRSPVVLDVSTINYRRVPGSRTLSYYIITSGLIPKLKNQLRAECDITSIKPDSLFFSFDRIITKQVQVIPDVEVLTEKQYLVEGNMIVDPDTITITGPKRILDTIKTIKTRHKKLRGVDETITRSFALVTSKECTVSSKKVILTIPVEQFTEAEIKVPVKILNSPDSINIKIFPDVVSVRYLVAISDYKKIEGIPFEVVLDLANTDLNSSEKIPLGFRNIPPFVSSLRVTPSKVDFLIEKKVK